MIAGELDEQAGRQLERVPGGAQLGCDCGSAAAAAGASALLQHSSQVTCAAAGNSQTLQAAEEEVPETAQRPSQSDW